MKRLSAILAAVLFCTTTGLSAPAGALSAAKTAPTPIPADAYANSATIEIPAKIKTTVEKIKFQVLICDIFVKKTECQILICDMPDTRCHKSRPESKVC